MEKNEFFCISESKSAKQDYERNCMLTDTELLMKINYAVGTDNTFGAKVVDKLEGKGLFLDLGHDIKTFLYMKNSDVTRRYSFIQRAVIDSTYINVTITAKNEDGRFSVSRNNIVQAASEYHRENIKIGDIITATVVDINDYFVFFDIGAGDCRGCLHVSNIADKFVKTNEYFYIGQENVNLIVKGYNDEFDDYDLKYHDVRQMSGIRTSTIVEAEVTEPLDDFGHKFKCILPDFGNAQAILYGVPKGYVVDVDKSDRIRVTITGIKQNIPMAKF